MIKYNFQLDTTERGRQYTVLGVHAGDTNTRALIIELVANGKRWEPPDGAVATLWATLPNGQTVYKLCEILPRGVISITLSGSTEETEGTAAGETTYPGMVECELRITSNKAVLTSPAFGILVEGTLQNDSAIEAQDNFSALTRTLQRVIETEQEVAGALDAASEAQNLAQNVLGEAKEAQENAESALEEAKESAGKVEGALERIENAETGLGSKIDKFDGAEGNVVVFGKGGGIADGGMKPPKVYVVPYYSPSTITEAQKAEIRDIVNAVAADKGDYALFMKVNPYVIPASIEVSRNKVVRATIHDNSNSSYEVVVSPSGEVTTSHETIYVMDKDKIGSARTKAPTGAAMVAFVVDYVAEHGGNVSTEELAKAIEAYFEENPPVTEETDPTVFAWAKEPTKPTYTASEVGALPSSYTPPDQTAEQVGADAKGTADSKVSAHNTSTASHNDIRLLIEGLTTRLNALADSTDEDLDQLSEIVAYIKSNKSLIESITTNKVNVSDIINNLTTNVSTKPLSAAQGVALKALIDAITVPTKLSQLSGDSTHRVVTDAEKNAWNAKSDFSGKYSDLTGKPTIPTVPTNVSAFQNDAKYVTEEQLDEALSADAIPDYWYGAFTDSAGKKYTKYLDEKISAIRALQAEGGKDCFSFVVMTDMHYESNLAKLAPVVAKKIMDECGIKFALELGDKQTRHGAKYDEAYIKNEWDNIDKMLSPVRDRLLSTQGNHDGSYGWFDLNNDGVINDDVNGDGVANSYDKDVYNYTPQMLYERIFRKVSTIDNVHFSEDGKGYYVDDTASKVRYIILSSHNNKYELNSNGSIKYNNMYNFRFGQAQYDMVVEALSSIPSDSWSVICASHVPLDRSGEYVAWGGTVDANGAQTGNPADCVVMMRLLNAYVKKTTYTGEFSGNEGGGAGYVNLANTSSADWWSNSRLSSSGTQYNDATGRNVTNYIPYTDGDIIKLKGLTLYSADRLATYDANKTQKHITTGTSIASCVTTADGVTYIDTGKLKDLHTNFKGCSFIRLPVQFVSGEEAIITTGDLNAKTEAFDDVSISADFTSAKGTLISYHGGHIHKDNTWGTSYSWNGAEHSDFNIIATRCDGVEENETSPKAERIAGTPAEQSFDVFTVNRAERKIYATKIGAGSDREISY